MAPRLPEQEADGLEVTDDIPENDIPTIPAPLANTNTTKQKIETPWVWPNIIWYILLHIGGLYGATRLYSAHPFTWIWAIFLYVSGAFGITAGAHRLWAHRSYKAKLPFRILLGIFNCIAGQNSIIEWARDHRVHHKFSETDADPHNAKRGFFFAHMGWLMVKKHPLVKVRGRDLDFSDLYEDPVCRIQHKWYNYLVYTFCFVLPTVVPAYFWGESPVAAFFSCGIFRYLLLLHATWCVNSVAHFFGNKPYDQHINPTENFFVTFGAVGEGFHNYHHVFPSDYKTSEWGWRFNPTTILIDFAASIGQVTHRKMMSHDAVFKRTKRTGDGSEGFGYQAPTGRYGQKEE